MLQRPCVCYRVLVYVTGSFCIDGSSMVAGSTISDFGGDHPAVVVRGAANVQESQFSSNLPSSATPVVFGDVLPAAVALQFVEWPDFSESPETVRLGGQPNLNEPVFYSDDTSLNVALTVGLADPEWAVCLFVFFEVCWSLLILPNTSLYQSCLLHRNRKGQVKTEMHDHVLQPAHPH